MGEQKQINHIIGLETALAAAEKLNQNSSLDEALYVMRTKECDGHKAENLLENASPLQVIRTFLYRGLLEKADEALAKLKGLDSTSPVDQAELMLEEARSRFFAGDWASATTLCSEGLRMHPSAISQQVFLQLRAVSNFELGLNDLSLADLKALFSFEKMYPFSQPIFYGRLLRAKIYLVMNDLENVRLSLDREWKYFLATEKLNLDSFISILRVELFYAAAAGKDAGVIAHIIRSASKITGEELVEAEANFALMMMGLTNEKTILEAIAKFLRLRRVKTEIDGMFKPSTTASLYKELKKSNFRVTEDATAILLERFDCIIHLSPWKVVRFKPTQRSALAMRLLLNGPIEKEDFFINVWRLKYHPARHDNTIYRTVSKIRQDFGIQVKVEDGIFEIVKLLKI